MNNKVEYWINIAEYDLQTAKALLKTSRFLYVGFMCHQTIEKALKALIARNCAEGELPPKIHDLVKLAVKGNLYNIMTDKQQDFIYKLNPLNIDSRYPDYEYNITESITEESYEELIVETEELLCWIKAQL